MCIVYTMNTCSIYEADLHNEKRYIKLIFIYRYLLFSNVLTSVLFTLMRIHGNV